MWNKPLVLLVRYKTAWSLCGSVTWTHSDIDERCWAVLCCFVELCCLFLHSYNNVTSFWHIRGLPCSWVWQPIRPSAYNEFFSCLYAYNFNHSAFLPFVIHFSFSRLQRWLDVTASARIRTVTLDVEKLPRHSPVTHSTALCFRLMSGMAGICQLPGLDSSCFDVEAECK